MSKQTLDQLAEQFSAYAKAERLAMEFYMGLVVLPFKKTGGKSFLFYKNETFECEGWYITRRTYGPVSVLHARKPTLNNDLYEFILLGKTVKHYSVSEPE